MTYALRKVEGADHVDELAAMHTLTLPADEHVDYTEGWWWIVRDANGDPVAYAGSRWARSEPNAIYLCRAGVLAGHRGHGLQRRLILARLRHARSVGASAVVTTTYDNPPSGNNLIRAGFRLYRPAEPWGCAGTNYWRLPLTSP